MIRDKLVVVLDEASGRDTFTQSDKLKALITEEVATIEKKSVDGEKINFFGRLIMLSNSGTACKIENSDRRYMVYKCANDVQNNEAYHAKLVQAFQDTNMLKSFYNMLMERDISKWDKINDRPLTDAYMDIKSANIPRLAQYLDEQHRLYNLAGSYEEKERLSKMLVHTSFDGFIYWTSKYYPDGKKISIQRYGRDLSEWGVENGVDKHRHSSGNGTEVIFDFEKINKHLIKKGWIAIN
jgi:hypothetical protein